MQDLKTPGAMWLKAALFFAIAAVSSILLLVELPAIRTAVLLALAIWASCRAYYFAFYVIHHYVDPTYHFSGLGSFMAYLWQKRSRRNRGAKP